jgi:putative heme-binding domain-containing protein
MLPGQADGWIERLAADACDDLRVVALRLCRRANRDVLALVERFLDDPSPAVRREAAIALKGVAGPRADRAWAALASRHAAGDRWELEALGIGADGPAGLAGPNHWDGRLAAWLDRIAGRWRTEAGREIVWRSRAAATPALACEVIGDPGTVTGEALAFVRALDFQDSVAVQAALGPLVAAYATPEETRRAVLPELVIRLDPTPAQADPRLAARIDEAATCAAGSQRFLQIVDRFHLVDRIAEVVRLATATDTAEQTAAMAVAVALDAGGADAIKAALARGDDATIRLLAALGIRGSAESRALVAEVLADDTAPPEVLAAAVRALARSHSGARELVTLAAAGDLAGPLLPVAGMAIALAPYADVRQAAAGVLPLPQTRGGEPLPPVAELLRRSGDAAKGRDVFAGAGTCSKCHVVGDAGRAVGPALSGIGAKLSRPALYEAILAPSAAISHSFETWTAVLDDGRSATGLLVSQSSDQVVLRGADGIDLTLPAGEIETLIRQPVSLMPADLAAGLSPQDLVDLVAWLETLRATN